jgi:hypothetical protein
MANRVYNKFKRDPNLKEVIIDLLWMLLYKTSTQVSRKCSVSEEEKSVNIVKEQETHLLLWRNVQHAEVLEK